MDLKKFLKTIKLNESSISMVLGALVIVIVGVLVVNYVKDRGFILKEGGVATNEASLNTHTVAQNETLWTISEKYYGTGYKWVEIAKANSLQNADQIEVGQTLTLPNLEEKVAEITQEQEPGVSIPADSYTVQKGDHLWGVAVRAYGDGYKWVEIAKANNLKNPNLLFVGTVLTLPR